MPANLYDYTIPELLRGFRVLQSCLDKMQAAVDHGQFTEKKLLRARLANDMPPLGWQIQIVIDNAKNGPARLTGRQPILFAYNEQAFEEYRHRNERSIAFLQTLRLDEKVVSFNNPLYCNWNGVVSLISMSSKEPVPV